MNELALSQALVAEYPAATCSDGGQSVPLNTSRMPLLYLPSVKMTAFSRLSRFGMTFGHSTVESGAALLMWFRVDFLAGHQRSRNRAGITGERSGLWREMARIILCEVRPRFVYVENSPVLTSGT